MYDCTRTSLANGNTERFTPTRNSAPIPYAEVLHLWQYDEPFRTAFIALLAASPFPSYRWETPPITRATAGRPFEFVLCKSFAAAKPDPNTFAEHFATTPNQAVAVFPSLGGRTLLITPTPIATPQTIYIDLARFVRGAPPAQCHALWQATADALQSNLADTPIWLSTAGGGVDWLHVRLDPRPKYYRHTPYCAFP